MRRRLGRWRLRRAARDASRVVEPAGAGHELPPGARVADGAQPSPFVAGRTGGDESITGAPGMGLAEPW